VLKEAERLNYAEKWHYFWFGKVGTAVILAARNPKDTRKKFFPNTREK
jgi:hypothetical protein